jgi:hypothetical protein
MSRPHSALIVDADPKGLEVLVYGFQEGGWNVTVCPLIETVPLLVKASGAQILVLSSREEHEKALALLAQLRNSESARSLAFLLLAPETVRSQVHGMDDVDFLAMPTFMADILCASTIIAGTRALWNRRTGREEATIEIPIPPQGPLSFIRTLCGLGRSGIATIEHSGRHGEIWFHEGEVTAAQFGSLQGVTAAHHLLLWDSGWIRLHLRSVARRGQLRQTQKQFLEEALRFLRDFKHHLKDIGPRDTVYLTDEARLTQISANVPSEVMPVMRLCDGKRTLSDLIDESPFRVLDTFRIISRMLEVDALTRRDPQSTPTPTPIPAVPNFWETARVTNDSGTAPSDESPPILLTPTPDPQIISLGIDRRSSSSSQNRRRARRQPGKPTPSHGTPIEITPRVETTLEHVPSGSMNDPKAAVLNAQVSPTKETSQRTSGTIESQGSDRRAKAQYPTNKERVSIVVSLHEEKPHRPTAAPVSVPPIVVEPIPLPASASQKTATGTPKTASVPAESSGGRLTGVMQVVDKKRAIPTTTPHPASRSSIQFDASLLNEPSNQAPAHPEKSTPAKRPATIPPEKSVVSVPIPVEKSVPHTAQVPHRPPTGPSGHPISPVKGSEPIRMQPHLESGNVVTPPAPAEAPSGDRSKGRISGAFNAVESDFFAREADLYKEESVDSFADLEDKNSRSKLSGKRKRR